VDCLHTLFSPFFTWLLFFMWMLTGRTLGAKCVCLSLCVCVCVCVCARACPSTSALSVMHLREGIYHFSEHFEWTCNKSRGAITPSYFHISTVLRSGKRVSEKKKQGQSDCERERVRKISTPRLQKLSGY